MDIQQKWRTTVDRLRFVYGPSAANLIVSISALPARLRLFRAGPISILVDNTVLFHAVTHETAWVSTGKSKWGPHDIDTGYAARIPVRHKDSDSRDYRNIKYLPGIAHLARMGQISLKTAGELALERFKQPVGRFHGYGMFDHNLFSDIDMAPLDGMPDMVMSPKWMNLPSIEEQQHERLANSSDSLFRGLVKLLGPKNNQDAWHIRTAEVHGMFCFLTMDFKLCNNFNGRLEQEPIKSLRTKVMTPAQLGRYLRIFPVDPNLLSYTAASFPVRPDLHWPDEKRHGPTRNRSR
ncbi:MAG: hypothetical protein Q8O58_05730 [Gallionella sp.]|nr:hypothetical protein [Gallionella sp.]